MKTKTENDRKRSASKRDGRTLPRLLLIFPLVFLPLLLGGARPWFWSAIAGIFTAGLAWSVWSGLQWKWFGDLSKRWLLVLGLPLLYPFLQCLPLPASLVAQLSPQLMRWQRLVTQVTLVPIDFVSISYTPLVTFFAGLWWVFLACCALLFRTAIRKGIKLDWLFLLLCIIASCEAVYGLLQALIPSLGVLWESPGQGIARGTFVNRNHYAAFLGMLWPLLLASMFCLGSSSSNSRETASFELAKQKEARQRRWFIGFLIGVILLALVFSQSRAGIAGALLSLTVFVVVGKRHRKQGMVAFLAGSWMMMLVYGSMIGFEDVFARFDQLEMDTSGRMKIWGDTLRLIEDHWLTGCGLGTFSQVIRVYQSHLTDEFDIVHAHNDYLELAGELGVPMALGLILLVWGYWGYCAYRLFKEGEAADEVALENRRLIALGALAGGAAFFCQSWVEFNWQIPANQFYFVVLLILMKI